MYLHQRLPPRGGSAKRWRSLRKRRFMTLFEKTFKSSVHALSLRHFLRKCHLPPQGGFGLVPLKRVYVTVAWRVGQSTAHPGVAGSIRAMPETEIRPVTGDLYFFVNSSPLIRKSIAMKCGYYFGVNIEKP